MAPRDALNSVPCPTNEPGRAPRPRKTQSDMTRYGSGVCVCGSEYVPRSDSRGSDGDSWRTELALLKMIKFPGDRVFAIVNLLFPALRQLLGWDADGGTGGTNER